MAAENSSRGGCIEGHCFPRQILAWTVIAHRPLPTCSASRLVSTFPSLAAHHETPSAFAFQGCSSAHQRPVPLGGSRSACQTPTEVLQQKPVHPLRSLTCAEICASFPSSDVTPVFPHLFVFFFFFPLPLPGCAFAWSCLEQTSPRRGCPDMGRVTAGLVAPLASPIASLLTRGGELTHAPN